MLKFAFIKNAIDVGNILQGIFNDPNIANTITSQVTAVVPEIVIPADTFEYVIANAGDEVNRHYRRRTYGYAHAAADI